MEGISSFLSPPLLKILIIKFRIYGIGGEGWEYGRHGVYFMCECVSTGVGEILLQINYYIVGGGVAGQNFCRITISCTVEHFCRLKFL